MSRRGRQDEGATVDQTAPGTGHAGGPGRNGHGRGSFDRERQARSAYLVGVLGRALTAQVEELAQVAPATPDGWWFAEPDRTDHPAGAPATNGTPDGQEQR